MKRAITNEEAEFMRRGSREWPRTSLRGKFECPDCHKSGYAEGTWMLAHTRHRRCACGSVQTARGLGAHQRHCGHRDSKEYP